MTYKNLITEKQEEFLTYLINKSNHSRKNLPSIKKMSEDLKVSSASLREQMELLKTIGVISAKPRKGIRVLDYQFTPAIAKSLYYAVKLNASHFEKYSEIRNHLEKSYFLEAAKLLCKEDQVFLQELINTAMEKLKGYPIQIPHLEHRNFHMQFYQPVNNIFLFGLLEAYWDTYELVGLDVYTDLNYLENVWKYHQMILDKVIEKDFQRAFEIMIEHMQLIYSR